MRELVYKNLTTGNKKRKDLFITETVEKDGLKTVTRRHSMYVVGGHTRFSNPKEVMYFKKIRSAGANKRHIFIFKKRDSISKKDIFVCDVVGKFYAVVKNDLYSVAFKHSLEIDFFCTEK